jgi:hypothetical protein
VPRGAGNFLLHHHVQTYSGTHPGSYQMGRGELYSLRVKRPGREANHSPPSSADVKNAWIFTSTCLYVFMARCLVKLRNNFTFPLQYTKTTKVTAFHMVRHKIHFTFGHKTGFRLISRSEKSRRVSHESYVLT